MYKPLEMKLELWFNSEDEDEVTARIEILESDGEYTEIDWTTDSVESAVLGALNELFDGGDLGDLFWPLQNEDA